MNNRRYPEGTYAELNKLINIAFRIRGGYFYYFDEYGIVRKQFIGKHTVEVFEKGKLKIKNIHIFLVDGKAKGVLHKNLDAYFIYPPELDAFRNGYDGNLCSKLVAKLNEGSTISTLNKLIPCVGIVNKDQAYSDFEQHIHRVNTPDFRKYDGKHIDYISVTINVSKNTDLQYLKENKREIIAMAVGKIKRSGEFKKAGVPMNFWKLSKLTLCKNCTVEMIFELKQIED